jgi:hypothetical protein
MVEGRFLILALMDERKNKAGVARATPAWCSQNPARGPDFRESI